MDQLNTMDDLNAMTLKRRGPKRKLFDGEKCQICNENGTGFNYGALTCNPCKSFFRRTILENKLSTQCESNDVCADNLRRFCSGCRLRQCLEVGMKANYVRELNIKRIRRRIEKIPKHHRLLKFSETLDPFQENILSVIEGFWVAYRDCAHISSEINLIQLGTPYSMANNMFMQNPVKTQFVQKTTDDALNLMEGKLTKFHLPDYEGSNGLEKLNFVKDFIDFQVLSMNLFLTTLQCVRWHQLTEPTKREILLSTAMEIPIMRFATRYRHQISAEFLDILANLGISMRGREGIVRLMIDFNRLQLDTYEQGLMSAICATSADRGVKDKFDYAVLSATQETVIEVLRIKFDIDDRPMRLMASCIGFLTELRSFSYDHRDEIFKFVHHVPKILSNTSVVKKESRKGLEYIGRLSS